MEKIENISQIERNKETKRKSKNYVYGSIKWIVFIIFIIYALSLLIPFIWMLLNTFKSNEEFNSGNIWGLPKQFYGLNFLEILQYEVVTVGGTTQTVFNMFLWSCLVTVTGTIISVGLSAIAAYVLSKYKFIGRGLIYGAAIFTMVVPIVGTLPSQVRMMEMLGLDDSFLGVLFLYSGCFGFNFIMLYSAFSSISWSYAEAANMDGAGRFKIFFKVMLPMCKGPIIACCILQAITLWNDYSTPYLFMPSHYTLAVGLNQLQTEFIGNGNYPMMFASVIFALIPVLILYACFQKKIIENTNAGGLKG